MLKCDFKKLQRNFIEIALRRGSFSVNLLHIFITRFSRKTSAWLLLNISFWKGIFKGMYLEGFHGNKLPYHDIMI